MNKKINAKELRVGMYIINLDCSWLNHPFTLNKFIINTDNDIKKIHDANIKLIEIDTLKGLDVLLETNSLIPFAIKSENKIENSGAKAEMKAAKIAFKEAKYFISNLMVSAKMGQYVELEQINPVIKKLSESILRNHNALLALTRIRKMDHYTFEHSVSFSVLMMSFAKGMGKSKEFIRLVGIGGLLHDIGKTMTPDHILNKPGKLTPEEFLIMKEHVVHSRLILEKTPGLSQISMDIAVMHHEKIDGNGYPDGLKGDQISLAGQMSAIVDVYDALTADRCYHDGKDPTEALNFLLKGSGSHFNPELVQKFIQSVGIYPAGCLVRLDNDHLAKVVEIKGSMLKPVIEVFFNIKTRKEIPPQIIDLSTQSKLKINAVDRFENWNFKSST